MTGVMIFGPTRNSPFLDITIARARASDARLILKDAVQTRAAQRHRQTLAIAAKNVSALPLGDTGEVPQRRYNDPYAMDSSRLRAQVQFRKATGQGGSDLANLEITLGQKYALPFASFIAILIALPLAVLFGKKGRTLGIALSVVVLFVYYILSAVGAAFGKNGAIEPWIAVWLPNAIMATAGGYMIYREDH